MDPWNGTGTTTYLADNLGYGAIGFDINPVMVITAKGRSIDLPVRAEVPRLTERIVAMAYALKHRGLLSSDPLETWLERSTACLFRNLEKAIYSALAYNNECLSPLSQSDLAHVPHNIAFFYTALFRTLRTQLHPFRSSNPTWIKVPSAPSERLHVPIDTIINTFKAEVTNLLAQVTSRRHHTTHQSAPPPYICVASSTKLPLPDRSVDAVISSPPYCTRIDYVVATLPELALLGLCPRKDAQHLRQQMIGTPTISPTIPALLSHWGPTCTEFLYSVANHTSKASRSYYLKTFLQYFHGIFYSLEEIDRTLRPPGHCVLVVQDSYYKDIHNNLPMIFVEMAHHLGWHLLHRTDFSTNHTLASINHRAKKYRPRPVATESALIFLKPH